MHAPGTSARRHVVVAGGGVAALESVLALRALGGERLDITLVAPGPEFKMRALEPLAPFGHTSGPFDLAAFAREHDIALRQTGVLSVDAGAHTIRCATGPDQPYDTLIVAIGAVARPAAAPVITVGTRPATLEGLVNDLKRGYSKSVAFVVPKGCSWPLPLYELALMTAREIWNAAVDGTELHLVTPEPAPLSLFGREAGVAVAELLHAARITAHCSVVAELRPGGVVDVGYGEDLNVSRVVALPVLEGPSLPGLPCDEEGFIPVDDFGRVAGAPDVYAVGDVTARPIKQGGLACQQADAAALHVAAAAGADVQPEPFSPVLHGRLLTGMGDRFLRREPDRPGQVDIEPLWWPPAKVAGRYLAPYLQSRGLIDLPPDPRHSTNGIDVRFPFRWSA